MTATIWIEEFSDSSTLTIEKMAYEFVVLSIDVSSRAVEFTFVPASIIYRAIYEAEGSLAIWLTVFNATKVRSFFISEGLHRSFFLHLLLRFVIR